MLTRAAVDLVLKAVRTAGSLRIRCAAARCNELNGDPYLLAFHRARRLKPFNTFQQIAHGVSYRKLMRPAYGIRGRQALKGRAHSIEIGFSAPRARILCSHVRPPSQVCLVRRDGVRSILSRRLPAAGGPRSCLLQLMHLRAVPCGDQLLFIPSHQLAAKFEPARSVVCRRNLVPTTWSSCASMTSPSLPASRQIPEGGERHAGRAAHPCASSWRRRR